MRHDNYESDHRVRALHSREDGSEQFDARRMTITVVTEDDDGLESEVVLPARF